jgi:hypothetical protein
MWPKLRTKNIAAEEDTLTNEITNFRHELGAPRASLVPTVNFPGRDAIWSRILPSDTYLNAGPLASPESEGVKFKLEICDDFGRFSSRTGKIGSGLLKLLKTPPRWSASFQSLRSRRGKG